MKHWIIINESAFEALAQLITIEGEGSSVYEDQHGNIVFKKRRRSTTPDDAEA